MKLSTKWLCEMTQGNKWGYMIDETSFGCNDDDDIDRCLIDNAGRGDK